jgi:hypothetical protein
VYPTASAFIQSLELVMGLIIAFAALALATGISIVALVIGVERGNRWALDYCKTLSLIEPRAQHIPEPQKPETIEFPAQGALEEEPARLVA